jgi:D-aspartate ligase
MQRNVQRPLACVLAGDIDLIRPLGLAGIRCAVVAHAADPVRFSRFADIFVDSKTTDLLERLLEWGRAQRQAPVLMYESDWSIEFVARHRGLLSDSYRFVLPPNDLVDALLDKSRFSDLARERGLPVPGSRHIRPAAGSSIADIDIAFPAILKAVPFRRAGWKALGAEAKVLHIDSREALRGLWPRLVQSGLEFVIQELIVGPESRIESYHVYVDSEGQIAGEFTGRKIRTHPREYGATTALVTTRSQDVADLGREVVQRIGLSGVAKLDFKRAPDGKLYLLEINPRFSLWNHVGALAGVNVPAIVYADLVGLPRPPSLPVQAGVTWCRPLKDAVAAREHSVPLHEWVGWAVRSDTNSTFALDDAMPVVRGQLWPRIRKLMPASR